MKDDQADPSKSGSVSLEFDLKHSPEKVWRALTDSSLLAEWLLPVFGMELSPGAVFTFQAPVFPNWDGTVNCRILEVEPFRKLSYTWAVGGDLQLDTIVTFTLAPTASGTRLSVLQSGFTGDQKQARGGARYGWKMMGGRLVDLLARMS